MARVKKPSPEDIELFRRSVGPVRRIGHDKTDPVSKLRTPRPRVQPRGEERLATDSLSDGFDAGTVSADEALFHTRPGLQQRQLQRLRRGQLPCGAELDLHGMTTATARNALVNFIAHAVDQGIRCVRLIHGKGYGSGGDLPVLKNRLNAWLRQHHDVLAFSSAQPRDGGSGALYVLLRSVR